MEVTEPMPGPRGSLSPALALLESSPLIQGDPELCTAVQILAQTLAAVPDSEAGGPREHELLIERDRLLLELAAYEQLFDRAPDAYLVSDSQGMIRRANRASGRLFSRAPELLTGKPLFVLVAPNDRRALRKLLVRAVQQQFAEAMVTFAPSASEGRVDTLVSIDATRGGADAGSVEARWLIRDVTHRRHAEAAEADRRHLERINDEKDALLGMVSHELRTPLTVIFGNAQVLRQHITELSLESTRAVVDEIWSNSGRLGTLIENMLTLARMEHTERDFEPIMLQRMLPEVIDALRARAASHSLTLQVPPALPPVVGEPSYVQQVVENLVSNAVKYSPAGTKIDVSVLREEDMVAVKVADEGPGIAPEQLRRVFEPFVRSPANTIGVPGVGLGLTVCKRLVQAMQGTMSLLARPEGGLEASFTIPVWRPSPS